jgi:guanylate kinase
MAQGKFMKKGLLFIVSAPSGAGKTSLAKYVIQTINPDFNLSKIITYTTRLPRLEEIKDVDYHFISLKEFEQKKNAGFFIETTEYNNNFYGTPRNVIPALVQGKSFLIIVDRVGAQNLKNIFSDSILIWLTIPNLQVLHKRIQKRGTEKIHELEARFALAKKEISDEKETNLFNYHICNDNFKKAAHEILEVITQELNLHI